MRKLISAMILSLAGLATSGESSAAVADHTGCLVTYWWAGEGSDAGAIYYQFTCLSPAAQRCYSGGVNGYLTVSNSKQIQAILLAHYMSGKRLNVRTDLVGPQSEWSACNIVAISSY